MLNKFINFLKNKSIEASSIDLESISFNYNGLNYVFTHEKADPFYFRILLPRVYKLEDDAQRWEKFMNDLNWRYRVVKAYELKEDTNENIIWLSFEQYVYTEDNVNRLFDKAIESLKVVYEAFVEEVKNQNTDFKK